jgi:superfamily I DNA/RNA helicase
LWDISRVTVGAAAHKGRCLFSFSRVVTRTLYSSVSGQAIPSTFGRFGVSITPFLLKAIRSTYSHVFLDEFQDTTFPQYDLVKTLFLGSSSIITAVGDAKQRIMGWAGAMPYAFDQFKKDYKAKELELIINYRSAPTLVNIQSSIISEMMGREVKVRHSDHWEDEEGSCNIWIFNNEQEEVKKLSKDIKSWIQEENVSPRDICILTRMSVEKYSELLIKELKNLNIRSRIEEPWQELLSESFMPSVLDIFSLVIDSRNEESWTRLVSFIRYLRGELESESYTIEREIDIFLKGMKKELQSKNFDFYAILQKIISFFDIALLKNTFPEYTRGNYLENQIFKTAQLLKEAHKGNQELKETLDEFLGKDFIPIMSIHKSKGLEFDTVILLGLEDDAFWNYKNNKDEELFTFFVALSRAKRRMIFTGCATRFTYKQSRQNIFYFYRLLHNAGVKEEKIE